ncbi:type II toxin-antitoxin system RelB/DinJ family antitoxin [Escherichia marmotae]|uniref:type II toxin-antitoxin system RelB/DinJ family antitoxin n=1 Tax=Escherichia marmotae TaxID=1499973 RepID=UPI003D99DC0B
METRVQFRIECETKQLAKQALEKKGISLSDALRAFLDKLASTEKVMTKEETWLKEQIEDTFARVEKGEILYYSEEEADERMNSFISKIERQHEMQ